MKFDDYRMLIQFKDSPKQSLIDLLSLHSKFNIDIVWTEHKDTCNPKLKKILDKIEKKYKTDGSTKRNGEMS